MWKTTYGSLESALSGTDTESDIEQVTSNSSNNYNILSNILKKNNKNNTFIYKLLLLFLIVSTILLYFTIKGDSSVFLSLITAKPSGRTNTLSDESSPTHPMVLPPNKLQTVSSDNSNTLLFTLNRLGYPAMSTFTENKSSYLFYNFLSKHKGIIEPYAPMQLLVLNDDSSEYNYTFELCDFDTKTDCNKGSKLAKQPSETVTFQCEPHTVYKIKVLEFDPSTNENTGRMADSTVICMYVRRDIQALTENDLSDTMDAIHALWEYTDEEGQNMFGKKFHSASFFSEAHHFNSAWQMSDHIHEGLGFLPQHIKLTNLVEAVMQSVNPAVTMPYWEFTKEVAEGKTVFDSIMFSEKTFGSLTKPTDLRMGFQYKHESHDDGAIPDGRWAYLQSSPTRFHEILSGYGYLKAPWSMNPSKYITRYASLSPNLPTCTNYYKYLASSNNFITIIDMIQKDPHASLHSTIGNTFGCDKFEELRDQGLINNDDLSHIGLCHSWSYYMKDMYRNNLIIPDTSCSNKARSLLDSEIDTEVGDEIDSALENDINSPSGIKIKSIVAKDTNVCGYVCNTDTYEKIPEFLHSIVNKKYVPDELTTEDWELFRDFVCIGGGSQVFIGTHMESASSADPSFWPAHPTQERLVQAKFIVNNIKENDMNWPESAQSSYICATPSCFIPEYNSNEKGYYDECCYGHYKDDQLLDFVTGDPTSHFGETNYNTLKATNPLSDNYSMRYVYDEFDWSHCTDDNDIMSLLHSQYVNHNKVLST